MTFVSAAQLQKNWLHSTFRVRRQVVYNVLTWLKENNMAYYGDVEISAERIRQLPEDDIPDEILHGVRQCTDSGVVDQESEGYVPLDEEEDVDTESDLHGIFSCLLFRNSRTADCTHQTNPKLSHFKLRVPSTQTCRTFLAAS